MIIKSNKVIRRNMRFIIGAGLILIGFYIYNLHSMIWVLPAIAGFLILISKEAYRILRRIDREGISIKRETVGFILVMSGLFILLYSFKVDEPITIEFGLGFGLLLLGIIIVMMPSVRGVLDQLEYIQEIRLVGGMLLIAVGGTALIIALIMGALSWYLGGDSAFLIIGLFLILLGIIIMPAPSREDFFRFLRIPFKRPWHEQTRKAEIPSRKPKGFSGVNEREYEEIPKGAVEPYTEESIHNLIAQGRPIVKCKGCGAYYDRDVWKYYGKMCARIGCSNSEI